MTPKLTPENTAFISVGAYPNPELRCANIIRSARKFGVPLKWLSWKKPWLGFIHHKVRGLYRCLPRLRKQGVKYVFMLDAKDCVFTDSLDTILSKASNLYEPGTLLFNDDFAFCFYPYKDLHYQEVLTRYGLIVNSGLLMGDIDTFETVIPLALKIMGGIKSGTPREGIATYIYNDPKTNKHYEDDQLMYQICSIYYPQYFRVDKSRYLFAFTRLLTGTRLKDLRKESIQSGCVGQASIIHSASTVNYGSQQAWDKWVRQNNLVD